MQRVVVIGSPGAGKSTFARALAKRTGLPLVHLDAEFHLPGWVDRDEREWSDKLGLLLVGDRWIMDGNYGGSMDRRLARSETAILLDYPTALCLWRVLKRVTRLHGEVRPDAAPGSPARFDWEFMRYVAAFRTAKSPAIERRLAAFEGRVIRFHRPADAQTFLDRLG